MVLTYHQVLQEDLMCGGRGWKSSQAAESIFENSCRRWTIYNSDAISPSGCQTVTGWWSLCTFHWGFFFKQGHTDVSLLSVLSHFHSSLQGEPFLFLHLYFFMPEWIKMYWRPAAVVSGMMHKNKLTLLWRKSKKIKMSDFMCVFKFSCCFSSSVLENDTNAPAGKQIPIISLTLHEFHELTGQRCPLSLGISDTINSS